MGTIIARSTPGRKLTAEEKDTFDSGAIEAMSGSGGAPYIRTQMISLHPVAIGNEVDTFAVDKRGRVYINFENLKDKDTIWFAGGLIHECWHVLFQHFARRQSHHVVEDFWAWATDMEINQSLPPAMKAVMKEIYYPSSFGFPDGHSAEEYYDMLVELYEKQQEQKRTPEQKKNKGQGGGQGGQSGSGSGNSSDSNNSQGGSSKQSSGSGNAPGKERGKSGLDVPFRNELDDCGSAQHGHNEDYEATSDEAPERSETDHQYVRDAVARAIQASADKGGTAPGTGTANIRAWADQILAPAKVRWQNVFRSIYVKHQRRSKVGRAHINPRMPARVQPVDDIMFPKRKSYRIKVGIAFDSSGSNFSDLKYILGEVHEIVRRGGVDSVYAFSVDAAPKDIKRIRRVQDVVFEGGGGTDMRVAFEQLEEIGVDIGIILTDCETPWPDEAPTGRTKYIIGGMVSRSSAQQAFDNVPEFLDKVLIDLNDR